jgi:hypothetical protein
MHRRNVPGNPVNDLSLSIRTVCSREGDRYIAKIVLRIEKK